MLLGTQEVGGDGVLRVGGCSTLDLAEEHGTPVYLYDEAEIRRMCRAYVDGFEARWPHVDVSYACKAFTAPAMMELALSEGLGLEVVSVGEMNMALRCGCPPELLTYHGTFKTDPDLEFAIGADCGVIVIDNLSEIAAIARAAERLGKVQPVLVRINPTVTGLDDPTFLTVGDDTKFGLSIEHGFAAMAIDRALSEPSLRLDGIHFHLSSQLHDFEPYRQAMGRVAEVLSRAQERHPGFRPRRIVAGGGRGVRYLLSHDPPSVEEWVDAIAGTFAEQVAPMCADDVRLGIEPGRSVVAESGLMLYTIGPIKPAGPPGDARIHYVIVDGGLSDNPRHLMYGAHHEIKLARDPFGEPAMRVTVCGRHSEPDILFPDRMLPELRSGDVLAVQSAGAYTVNMSSNYMGFLRPPVVFVKDGESRVVTRREHVDDLMATSVAENPTP
ncbi:MAG TPA: diaminopimelate decarboxylase [Thermoleophilaceae bacterium]|nr:diaminopimelate decarboxylase [Thermoleophilaceae bacterium]